MLYFYFRDYFMFEIFFLFVMLGFFICLDLLLGKFKKIEEIMRGLFFWIILLFGYLG